MEFLPFTHDSSPFYTNDNLTRANIRSIRVFYNLAVIAVNGNQHKTTYNTVQSNSVSTTYIAWRLNLTTRQFIAETTFFRSN